MLRESYQRDLQRLHDDILLLGSMVESMLIDAVDVLKRRDMEGSHRLIAYDQRVNEKRLAIEHEALTLIATQQPMAGDVRTLAAILDIASELERMGDYAKGDPELELLDFMLAESGRPVTFIAMFDRDDISEAVRTSLRKAAPMIARGARPQTSPLPLTREFNMRNPFSFAAFPSWKRVFEDKSKAAQAAVYRDPAFRAQFREELKQPMAFGNWERITVHEVGNPALKQMEGKTVAQVAAEQGRDPVDVFLDLTLEDDLDNEFTMQSFNTRVDRMAELLNDRSILLGLGDGGAHLDMLCDAGYPTYVLGTWVRERGVLTLEEAVRRMTSDPADFFGIRDRGRIALPRYAYWICLTVSNLI